MVVVMVVAAVAAPNEGVRWKEAAAEEESAHSKVADNKDW